MSMQKSKIFSGFRQRPCHLTGKRNMNKVEERNRKKIADGRAQAWYRHALQLTEREQ